MTMTNAEKVARSDAKRGIMAKTYKLPQSVVAEIEQLSEQYGIPQNQLLIQAIEAFKQTKGA
ncbi:ribbon-helix-helix protein, CopG family [Seminibacterium arietis]|uniref:Ribbon-helix-helix protein, CopG family n=1 Tax=Seminibacterium arietis TaxID=1173502 RepID=A0ABW3I641_9PAST